MSSAGLSAAASDWSSEPGSGSPAGEASWGDDFDAPRRQPGAVPRWAWTCGCGCLVLLAGVVLALALLAPRIVAYLEGFADPDQQWSRIEEVLEVRQRPRGVEPVGMPFVGTLAGLDAWILSDPAHGLKAALLAARDERGTRLLEHILEPDGEDPFHSDRHRPVPGTLRVQGRELECLRFALRTEGEEPQQPAAAASWDLGARGASILVDVTPAGSARRAVFQIARDWDLTPISDEEVRAFLEPFQIGDGR